MPGEQLLRLTPDLAIAFLWADLVCNGWRKYAVKLYGGYDEVVKNNFRK